MGRLNVYLPREIEQRARDEAARRGLSISQFLASTLRSALGDGAAWPPGYFEDTCGRRQGVPTAETLRSVYRLFPLRRRVASRT